MSFDGTFGVTNEIMNMLRQYGRTSDLIKAGSGAKLKPSTLKALNEELTNFSEENLELLAQSCLHALQEEFSQIIHDNLGLSLTAIEIAKRIIDADEQEDELIEADDAEESYQSDSDEEYIVFIYTAEAGSAEINITKMGATLKPNFNQMIQERPLLCWLLDSRSPFFSEEFAERLRDAAALMNFRGLLATNRDLREELSYVLGQVFRGEMH